MRVVIAGGHGQIALRLGRLLAERGDHPVGLIRNPDHADALREQGIEPVLLDLEHAGVDDLEPALEEADATVFAAGAGPGSGAARKDTVDRAGAELLADAAVRAGVPRHVLISSAGVESVRHGATPDGVDDVFLAYLRAKLAAEDHVLSLPLEATILRPGRLTNDPGTGRVTLTTSAEPGEISRDDVATVVLGLLDTPATAGTVLELVGGDTPVPEAIAAQRAASSSA
jgi:nucleoside-diphosphate-sugar epimerase